MQGVGQGATVSRQHNPQFEVRRLCAESGAGERRRFGYDGADLAGAHLLYHARREGYGGDIAIRLINIDADSLLARKPRQKEKHYRLTVAVAEYFHGTGRERTGHYPAADRADNAKAIGVEHQRQVAAPEVHVRGILGYQRPGAILGRDINDQRHQMLAEEHRCWKMNVGVTFDIGADIQRRPGWRRLEVCRTQPADGDRRLPALALLQQLADGWIMAQAAFDPPQVGFGIARLVIARLQLSPCRLLSLVQAVLIVCNRHADGLRQAGGVRVPTGIGHPQNTRQQLLARRRVSRLRRPHRNALARGQRLHGIGRQRFTPVPERLQKRHDPAGKYGRRHRRYLPRMLGDHGLQPAAPPWLHCLAFTGEDIHDRAQRRGGSVKAKRHGALPLFHYSNQTRTDRRPVLYHKALDNPRPLCYKVRNMARYPIPAGRVRNEIAILRSRFITTLGPAPTIEAARAMVAEIRTEFPDATHHCYAFLVGAPGSSAQVGMSDDGEPSGTAGRPMLAVLSGSGVGDIVAVVTRYFGGTKLGTGGLVRAYSGGVKEALAELALVEKIARLTVLAIGPYSWITPVARLLPIYEAHTVDQEYAADVTWQISVPEEHAPALVAALVDLSQGEIDAQML